MLEALGILLIFLFILYLAYFATKQIAKVKQGSMYQRNLKVIEVLQLGQGQYLYLVQVGTQYQLFSVTKENVRYCMSLSEESLSLEDMPQVPFKEQLTKLLKGKEETDESTAKK